MTSWQLLKAPIKKVCEKLKKNEEFRFAHGIFELGVQKSTVVQHDKQERRQSASFLCFIYFCSGLHLCVILMSPYRGLFVLSDGFLFAQLLAMKITKMGILLAMRQGIMTGNSKRPEIKRVLRGFRVLLLLLLSSSYPTSMRFREKRLL